MALLLLLLLMCLLLLLLLATGELYINLLLNQFVITYRY